MQDTGFKAAVVSSIAVAGGFEAGILEPLSRGWLAGLALLLLSVVGFFAKRDYTRFTDFQKTTNDRLASIEKAMLGFATNDRLASIDKSLQDCATQTMLSTAMSSSNSIMHGKMNELGHRQTVLESLLGLHGKLDKELIVGKRGEHAG